MRVALAGLGGVGRHVVALLLTQQRNWQRSYGVSFQLVAAADINGGEQAPGGFSPEELARLAQGDTTLLSRSDGVGTLLNSGADIVIDATPTDLETGMPGLPLVREALRQGKHAVLLSKGPLVVALPELRELAKKAGVGLKYSGATGAALPTLDTAQYSLMGGGLKRFSGIFNGTTNFILSWMFATGGTYEEGLRQAQRKGIAETNPLLDVEGYDTAVKTCILANSLFDGDLKLAEVPRQGIVDITCQQVQEAADSGVTLKLLGEAEHTDQGIVARVSLKRIPKGDWLARVDGTTKAILYETERMGELLLVGGASDPRAAAAAAWKDALQLARGW